MLLTALLLACSVGGLFPHHIHHHHHLRHRRRSTARAVGTADPLRPLPRLALKQAALEHRWLGGGGGSGALADLHIFATVPGPGFDAVFGDYGQSNALGLGESAASTDWAVAPMVGPPVVGADLSAAGGKSAVAMPRGWWRLHKSEVVSSGAQPLPSFPPSTPPPRPPSRAPSRVLIPPAPPLPPPCPRPRRRT